MDIEYILETIGAKYIVKNTYHYVNDRNNLQVKIKLFDASPFFHITVSCPCECANKNMDTIDEQIVLINSNLDAGILCRKNEEIEIKTSVYTNHELEKKSLEDLICILSSNLCAIRQVLNTVGNQE